MSMKEAFISFLIDENIPFQVEGDDVATGNYIYQFGNKGQYIGRVKI
mgnify:FL=1